MTDRPPNSTPRCEILVGDALDRLRCLPNDSVDMVLTSPPYFRLRDYEQDDQIGLEPAVGEWVDRLAAVMAECHRVVVPTGTVWLNLGDTFSTHRSQGAARKGLLLGPERLAIRLQTSGWIIRNKIVWAKPNPMPVSVTDRLAATYEFVYVLARQPQYFFDLDAIRAPHRSKMSRPHKTKFSPEAWRGPNSDTTTGLTALKAAGRVGHSLGKNPGDVWTLATSRYRGAHHATFPLTLAVRAIQAGCPEARCSECRAPWRRRLIRRLGGVAVRDALAATCECGAASEPCLVLDPFIGSGTTAVAAENLARDWLGVELNPQFAQQAHVRIAANRRRARPPTASSEAVA